MGLGWSKTCGTSAPQQWNIYRNSRNSSLQTETTSAGTWQGFESYSGRVRSTLGGNFKINGARPGRITGTEDVIPRPKISPWTSPTSPRPRITTSASLLKYLNDNLRERRRKVGNGCGSDVTAEGAGIITTIGKEKQKHCSQISFRPSSRVSSCCRPPCP
jgi:hypothetical protein